MLVLAAAALVEAAYVSATPHPTYTRAAPYPDGPPPGFTGGFGEQTCVNCHFDKELNTPGGSVTISGVPERFTAGQVYPLNVTLTRPGIAMGGFELSARYEQGGAQAGSLGVPADAQMRLTVVTDNNVQYAFHRRPGTALASPDTARWTVLWTAPSGGGAVLFNVAANAADKDDTTFGDYIYTTVATANPQR